MLFPVIFTSQWLANRGSGTTIKCYELKLTHPYTCQLIFSVLGTGFDAQKFWLLMIRTAIMFDISEK